jgi:uncharacterized protein (DUF2147 family)
MLKLFAVLFFIHAIQHTGKQIDVNGDRVCGKWMSTEKNLIVLVYKEGSDFRAKTIWFRRGDDPQPIEEWRDVKNPDPALRNRKILGLSILEGLRFDPESNSWEDGTIYDAKHGHFWNASATIDKQGQLKVRGYWYFKFIGKTLTFTRHN